VGVDKDDFALPTSYGVNGLTSEVQREVSEHGDEGGKLSLSIVIPSAFGGIIILMGLYYFSK